MKFPNQSKELKDREENSSVKKTMLQKVLYLDKRKKQTWQTKWGEP